MSAAFSIEEMLGLLNRSIIYQMSLNSHELFHSNLWAWLMEQDTAFAELFFPEIANPVKIMREEEHRDITIWEDGRAFVIENKFKSIPTESQLIGYENKLGTKFARGILTGIRKPSICVGTGVLAHWKFLSYDDIAKGIRRIIDNTTNLDPFTKEVVNAYTGMVELLSKTINEDLSVHRNHVVCFAAPKSNDLYETARLRDLLIKMHTDDFCSSLRNANQYKELQSDLPEEYKLILNSDFTRKSGLVDICYQKDLTPKHYDFRIGVQIQGRQFKLFVSKSNQKKGTINAAELFNEYLHRGWFEDYLLHPKRFKSMKTSMSPREDNLYQFNSYVDRSYCFIYQYFDINDDMNDDEIETMIWEYLKEAKQILLQTETGSTLLS